MCLIFLAWKVHPDYPLVVAANRDEFFARPLRRRSFWAGARQVLAGRDLEAGGTWMGITRSGRFAALTNYRDPAQMRSGTHRAARWCRNFWPEAMRRHGLIWRNECPLAASAMATTCCWVMADHLWWSSNMGGSPRQLAPGIYGVSNHLLDTPWPKVGAGKTALAAALERLPDDKNCWRCCRRRHPSGHALPQTGSRWTGSACCRQPSSSRRTMARAVQRC
jgi:uncharacterized protein with NRDE domain